MATTITEITFMGQQGDGFPLIQKLMEWGALHKDPKCPRGHVMKIRRHSAVCDKFDWHCHAKIPKTTKKCGYSRSIRKDTFFFGSRLSLLNIVLFVYFWVQNLPLRFITMSLGISCRTSVDWSSFCREVVFDGMFQGSEPIGGPGCVVEIYESKFGRKKYNRGHRVEGQWVFGGVERGTGKSFMFPVEKRDEKTLLPIIKAYIKPGTTIISDCWPAYRNLGKEGYVHQTVNHSLHFKNPETAAHFNNIEGAWRDAKNAYPAVNRKKEFFAGYLAKYIFMKNCRQTNSNPVSEFFKLTGFLYIGNPNPPTEVPQEDDDADDTFDQMDDAYNTVSEEENGDGDEDVGFDFHLYQ